MDLDFILRAKKAVAKWLTKHYREKGETEEILPESVFCVWSCKTLQNRKGIFAAPTPDHFIFECTYNGDKHEMYVDCYDKVDQIVLHDISGTYIEKKK